MCVRERGRARVSSAPAAGLFREPQHWGRPPCPPPAFPRETLQLDFPGFPERTRKHPCPVPHTCLVTQLVNTSRSDSVPEKEGHVRGQRASLLLPQAPTPCSTLHRGSVGAGGEAADTRPAQSRPVPPSLGEWRGRAWDQLLQPAGQARCRPLPSRLPERRANPRYCAENGDRHLWGAGDALGPHTESGATAPATGREMHERHCCLYD